MFRPYTLEDVYKYAEKFGYSRESVEILPYEYADGHYDYTVQFGREYTEMWVWEFEDLEGTAYDYEHLIW